MADNFWVSFDMLAYIEFHFNKPVARGATRGAHVGTGQTARLKMAVLTLAAPICEAAQ